MRDEASYVAFVEARWPALLRLAHLLTGSRRAGEDVLQGVLLTVFVRWGRIARLDSPEGHVRRMLVNASISRGRTQTRRGDRLVGTVPEAPLHEDGTLDTRVALWSVVRALPPRQRAVIVLRYYEDLTEAEIARVLGCPPGTVRSQAAEALRSLPGITDALEVEAQHLEVPPAPSADLLDRGHATVGRRRRVAGAATLGLALVAGAVIVLERPDAAQPAPDGRPSSVADLPSGVRPKVPYRVGRDIVTTDNRHRRVLNRPPLVLGPDVVVVSGDGTPGIEYSRFDGTASGALNGAPNTYLTGSSVVSPDGHWAAAPYDRDSGPVRVPVFDLERDVHDGVASFDTRADTFEITGIDNTGSVYASGGPDGATSWRWDHATGMTTALRGVDGRVVSVRNGHRIVVARGSGASTRTTIGTLDATDTFRPESTLTGPLATWSPDDKMVAHASRDRSGVVEVRTSTDERAPRAAGGRERAQPGLGGRGRPAALGGRRRPPGLPAAVPHERRRLRDRAGVVRPRRGAAASALTS